MPKWRLIREYLSVIRLVGPSEHAKAKTLLRLLEKSPLELFPPGSAERRSYISLVHEHLAADDSFSASEFADLVDQEISQLRDGSQTSGVLSASESQMRFFQVSFCAAKGEMVCALNYMERALAKTISGPRQRGNMQLALAALSSLFSGNTAEVSAARAASIIKKFNELKLLDPTPAPGYEINSLFSRVASQLISGSFIELTPAEAAAITSVIQEELQLLNRPWNFYTPTPAARMNAAMLMRFANESPFGDVVKLDDLIALHELLNHSVASRDIIAAFWHYSMSEERQVRNRKQIFRLETKKAHRQIRAASLFWIALVREQKQITPLGLGAFCTNISLCFLITASKSRRCLSAMTLGRTPNIFRGSHRILSCLGLTLMMP